MKINTVSYKFTISLFNYTVRCIVASTRQQGIQMEDPRNSSSLMREYIVGVLFLKNPKFAKEDVNIKVETENGVVFSDQKSSIERFSNSDGNQCLEDENEHENCDLQRIYKEFWNTFDASKLVRQKNNGEVVIFASKKEQMKLHVEETIRVLDAALTRLNQKGTSGDEDQSFSGQVTSMLGELK